MTGDGIGPHPLAAVLDAAAEGRFPTADGAVEVLPPDRRGTWGVVELTGHAYVLGNVSAADLTDRGADGYGGAGHPDVLRFLAGADGWIGCHDAVLVRRTGDAGVDPLPRRPDLSDHPRALRARLHRDDVVVFGNAEGLVLVGRGLVGRTEMAVELLDTTRGNAGAGRRLIGAALAALEPGRWCFAQVSPGNAASLRAFLACGFVPIGSEVLIHPETAGGSDRLPR